VAEGNGEVGRTDGGGSGKWETQTYCVSPTTPEPTSATHTQSTGGGGGGGGAKEEDEREDSRGGNSI